MTHFPHAENGAFAPVPNTAANDAALSVSAHHPTARGTNGWISGAANGNGTSGNGYATPNGNRAAEPRLHELVARAESSAGELERLARTTLDATAAATQAAVDLQERLRLGVRMLQAFDVQIQRSEQSAGQAQAQLNPQAIQQLAAQIQMQLHGQLAAIEQQSEMRIRGATEAFERRVAELVPFLDDRIRAAHEQVSRIVEDRIARAERMIEDRYGPVRDDLRRYADELVASFAARLDAAHRERAAAHAPTPEAEARLNALLARIDERAAAVDATMARAEDRLRQLDRQSVEAADSLLGTVGTAATLKDLVADEARESKRLADEAGATTRELQRELAAVVEQCTTVRATLSHELAEFREAARAAEQRSASVKALQTEIDALLTRLAPWEAAVRTNGQPMQQVVESVSAGLRQSVAEEMRVFSQTLRTLAARAEQSFANARFDEFSAVRESETTKAIPTPTPTPTEPSTPTIPHTSHLPIETRRLSAEILALDATNLLKASANV
ncbi:MAG: hypothetical protein U0572_00895 [Phycisphaerales bacterium]